MIVANFVEEDEMIERRRRLKAGSNQMAKMKNRLQELIDGHIEEDSLNRYAVKKWNKRIAEHKRNLRRWEIEARATSFNARKQAAMAKQQMRLDGLISSEEEDEEDFNEPIDFVTKNIATSENYQIDHERKIFKQARLTEKRIEIYKDKRKFEEEEKQKRDVMSLHKWDFIRGVRDEQTAIALEKKRNRLQMQKWLMMNYMHQMIKEIKR